jgi:hypothetical protein
MTKSKVYLLDCNVLIALAAPEHSLNARSSLERAFTRRNASSSRPVMFLR